MNFKLKNYLLLFLLSSFSAIFCREKLILWDIGDTLAKQNKLQMFINDIGIIPAIAYLPENPVNAEEVVFSIIEMSGGSQQIAPGELYAMHKTWQMPADMCDWMTGKADWQDILNRALKTVQNLKTRKYFKKDSQSTFIEALIKAIFNPEILAKNTYPLDKGIKLKKEIARQLNPQGKPKFIQGIFSNFAPEAYNLIRGSKQCSPIFDYIEQRCIYVSCFLGDMKPYKSAFNKVIQDLINKGVITQASDIIFIDDREENINGAKKCGIDAIWLKNGDWKTVRKELVKRGILPRKKHRRNK